MSKKKKKKSIAELASEAIHKQLELKGIDVLVVVGITVKEMKTRNCFGGIDKGGITIYEFTPKDELIEIDSFDWNNYESVTIDHFAMKSVLVFKNEGQEREIIIKDRKSTRLNSSHVAISYAVFCLKKKKKDTGETYPHRNTASQ